MGSSPDHSGLPVIRHGVFKVTRDRQITPHTGRPARTLRSGVNNSSSAHDPLASQLKHLVAGRFRLGRADPDLIPDHAALIGSELGLDSLDALELTMCVEETFGITIASAAESKLALASIGSLAAFIRAQQQELAVALPPGTQPCAC
jgi:acyl carrier protein